MPHLDYELLKIPSRLRALSRPLGLLMALLLVGFLGLTDYLSGSELSFSIFYLVPVSLAALVAGGPAGLVVSVVSASVWLFADLSAGAVYSHPLMPYWNAVTRLGYFCIHTLMLVVLLGLIERMKELSLKDPLTGAANWRYFHEVAQRELAIHSRSKTPMTMAYADLDNFKTVNDELGHEAGDEVLRRTVEVIQAQVRPSDLLARVGGDEFAILLPQADYAGAQVVLLRTQAALVAAFGNGAWPVSVSIGAVTFRAIPSTVEALVKRADELMYRVKRDGKNGLIHEVWPTSPDPKADAGLD